MELTDFNIQPILEELPTEVQDRYQEANRRANEVAHSTTASGHAKRLLAPWVLLDALAVHTDRHVQFPGILEMDERIERSRLEEEISAQRRRQQAKEALAAEQATEITLPAVPDLQEFIDQNLDDETPWLIRDLWASASRVLFTAAPKFGKTSTVANLLRSLADGDPFLGRFAVETEPPCVLLLDTEMTASTLARWLNDQQIHHTGRVRPVTLQGQLSAFNILEPETRARWAEHLQAEPGQVVILDNLRPVLDALGIDENKEAGRFLTAWDELIQEMGAAESLIVHHTGHSGERARGDSALRASNAAMWMGVLGKADDMRSDRYFSAYGRDVNVPESRIEKDDRGRLLIAGGSRKRDRLTAEAQEAALNVITYLQENPGSEHSGRSIETALKGDYARNALRAGINYCIEQEYIVTRTGKRNSVLHDLTPAGVAWVGKKTSEETLL